MAGVSFKFYKHAGVLQRWDMRRSLDHVGKTKGYQGQGYYLQGAAWLSLS